MQFRNIILAALPALALAQEPSSSGVSTTTLIATTVLTKTVTLSQLHTVTSYHQNTTSYLPTGTGSVGSTALTTSVAPTAVPTKGPANAGAALEAGKVALAGVAGMLVVAMM